ncbi:MAG: glycosyltransferase family 2 protein [Bacteroidetes bacterium]|jgi:polyisoprenyl-phosphate glycosyltransferase|nr:glycosyltransferase family 2 protein [Bacteroidota bacterium]MBT6687740.1 glycosyltransferase family 2 protein [Bacteroidota bacterium]MBT7143374.1 glycosyltransferase family 2 protein [Bacteroidota bacterium]MBT7490696.1 glycosyltransferase family 2 protein [Bacteroidota bacterium]
MNKIQNPEYSVVVPVYNSEESLEELFARTKATFEKLKLSFEVIFVEDSGRDNSWGKIIELKNSNPESITAIQLAKNFGQHNALFCGFHFAKGNFIITLDDDLQIPPEEIERLIDEYKISQADIVYGDLVEKQHSKVRNFGSNILKKSAKRKHDLATGQGSSFKLIKAELIKKILHHSQNFVYVDEILLWYTKYISFTKVRHEKRKFSSSTYTYGKLFRLFFNISIYYTKVPLKIMTYGGVIFSILSFIFGIRFLIRKVVFDVPLGYTSIIVTILFSTSIILFSLGVIGEYLNRIFVVQNRKPPYSIKSILE